MPYCEIPPASLQFLDLFGFRVLEDHEQFMIVESSSGREIVVVKAKPYLFFEDIADAMQMGATGIVMGT